MSDPTTPSPELVEPDAADPEPGATPPPPTGHPSVDAVLRGITQVAGQPAGDQIPAFQAAHRTLQETLASIDEE
jgi:hypothetical protein